MRGFSISLSPFAYPFGYVPFTMAPLSFLVSKWYLVVAYYSTMVLLLPPSQSWILTDTG